ncbi:SAP domain-containing protein [Trichonephila inaurata madagascariensis]|uniref:SAP domain-containing protein n=1 Tax=Trichonephila inaurata madagascariensis TaxID=2747483 RepID=A0A8X7BUE0_9ARAC|nr:SAP domain-containing protein [Trichonephila inaurata madagascariensis]
MADELNSENQIADVNIKNMKVTDLRKKLKDAGLPTTGTKSELIERLQESMLSEKGLELNSDLDSALLEETNEVNSVLDPLDEKDDDILDEEIALASPAKLKDASATEVQENKSVKEQVATNTSNATSQHTKVEKKIVLKRNHIPVLKMAPSKPVESQKDVDSNAAKEVNEETDSAENSSKEPSKIIHLSTKNLNEEEKIILRAKRFNTITSESTSGKTMISKDRKNGDSILSPLNSTPPTLEVLKKRAQRFGGSVSLAMKLVEEQERILKRKKKFGDISSGSGMSLDEEEKKKKRAERFKQQ